MTVRIECPWQHRAGRLGHQPALIEGSRSVSYSQIHAMAAEAACRLKALGIRPHDYVAIAAPNGTDYILVLLALWQIGAVACLLSTRLPKAAICDHLREIGCRYLFTSLPSVQGDAPKARVHGNRRYSATQEATVMFTSGTGGEPKAAVHTFGNHYYSALGANEHIPVAPGDRWLLSLPLYHVGGLGIVFRALLGKAVVVILQAQENIAGAILKYQVTHVSLVPTQFYRLLSDEKNIKTLRNLKAILLGGGPVPDSLIRQSVAYNLPLHATYGLTEMASQVATSSRLTKRNSTPKAKVLPCREVYISNKNEILVRGKTLFKGYIQGGKIHRPLNKKGWFYTGDLGCLDEDGMLRVTGRQDNMFISGGENIQPEEIERHLCRIEGIVQAVVVPVPDEEFGARPVAFVQRQEGVDLVPQEIVSRLSQHLPRFKIPRRIYAWPTAVPRRGIKLDRAYFFRLARQEAPSLRGI